MNTAIEQLRKLVMEGKEGIPNRGVGTFTLLQELTFIENRKQVDYFLAMHRYVKELKAMPDILIGPGRRWMTTSHVCHALGITSICLGSISLAPIDFWGNEDCDTFPCHAEKGLPRRVSINKRIDDYERTEMHDRDRIFGTRFCPH